MVFCAAFFFFPQNGAAQSVGSSEDVAALFPEPNRVAADYPDEPERYVALTFLWDYLHEKAPDAASAKSKRGTYYNASESIRTNSLRMGEAAATNFDNRVRELNADPNFKRSVLEKYGLANVSAETAPQRRNTDVTDTMIQGVFWKALPVLVITFALMVLIAKAVVTTTVRSPTFEMPPVVPSHGLPQLPEALRKIQVPGMRYTVEFLAGRVVDKETAIHTRHVTTTTPAQSYTVGNDVYFTPGQTSTTSSSTKVDTIWLRTPDQRETSWTLTGDNFKTRPGHIISAIARRVSKDSTEFLIAYNHTTGQLESLFWATHATRGMKAWLLTTLVGSVGFAIWIGIILSIDPVNRDALDRLLSPVVYWLEGFIPAAFIAWIIVIKAQGKVMQRRNAQFTKQYLPGFQQFLAQATPALQKVFPAA